MRKPRPGELKHLYSFLHSFQQTFTCLVCAGPCSEHWGVKREQVKGFVLRTHSSWGASAWTIPLGECAEKELAREELPGKEAPTWEREVRRAPEETQDQRLENSRGAALGKGFQVEEVVAKASLGMIKAGGRSGLQVVLEGGNAWKLNSAWLQSHGPNHCAHSLTAQWNNKGKPERVPGEKEDKSWVPALLRGHLLPDHEGNGGKRAEWKLVLQSSPFKSPFYQTELLTKRHLSGWQLNNLGRAQAVPCLQGELFGNTSHYTFHSFIHSFK